MSEDADQLHLISTRHTPSAHMTSNNSFNVGLSSFSRKTRGSSRCRSTSSDSSDSSVCSNCSDGSESGSSRSAHHPRHIVEWEIVQLEEELITLRRDFTDSERRLADLNMSTWKSHGGWTLRSPSNIDNSNHASTKVRLEQRLRYLGHRIRSLRTRKQTICDDYRLHA